MLIAILTERGEAEIAGQRLALRVEALFQQDFWILLVSKVSGKIIFTLVFPVNRGIEDRISENENVLILSPTFASLERRKK